MDIKKIRSMEEYKIFVDKVYNERCKVEKMIAEKNANKKKWDSIGYCQCCDKETEFLLDWMYSSDGVPNYRERLVCDTCGLNNRQRFMGSYLKKLFKELEYDFKNTVYCYEQVTAFYNYTKKICDYNNINIIGSEYLGFDKKPGETINNIRNEDASNLSFKDEAIDIIISNDVYEHVPDIEKALSEAYRVLKPKGKLIYSIPFYTHQNKVNKRAEIVDGNLIKLMPEQYHGNPVSEEGSLVFYDFGWDLINMCKKVGFKDSYMLNYYSMFYGYLGVSQFIFVSEK